MAKENVADAKKQYRIIQLMQPVASLMVSDLLNYVKLDSLNDCSYGETVIVYAQKGTRETLETLLKDETFFAIYLNAVNTGSIDVDKLPSDAYIGFFKIGNVDEESYHQILDAEVFDKPMKYAPNEISNVKHHKVPPKEITLKDHAIYVPISDTAWNNMENHINNINFYWKESYYYFYSYKYGFGDQYGRYDVVFQNAYRQKIIVQTNKDIISKENIAFAPENLEYTALVFHFDKLESSSYSESSFDILKEKEWILDWNCVKFQKGYFIVVPPADESVKFKPKSYFYPNVLESFNYLREYFNQRLDPIRCHVKNMQIEIYDQFKLNEAIGRFATASKQRAIQTTGGKVDKNIALRQMSFKQALSKAQKMTEEEFHKYKSRYIDFLVEQQSREYKIIPCVEKMSYANNDTTEYSFIFSVKCRNGNVMVVHENVNPDRSTLIFIVKKDSFKESIREIYDFLQGAEINKRSSLRSGSISLNRKKIIRNRSVNHDGLNSWKRTIYSYKQIY